MPWPTSQDYNEAIQSPDISFSDIELKGGQVVTNALGMPMPRSGNFADVYEFVGTSGTKWAIKCFTREVAGLEDRYHQIDLQLLKAKLPFTVGFQFQPGGIRIKGQLYPILKMQWIEGLLLNEFIRNKLDKPTQLEGLGQIWVRMARRLREANLAHADLQHGNVLMVPGRKDGSLAIKLIDYDGMWVPALANRKSGEVGHPAYQHPARLQFGTYSADVDRVPLLVIACALRCLVVGGKSLWTRYDNGDNVLFREADLKAPDNSALFNELRTISDPQAQVLVQELHNALKRKLEQAPAIDALFPEPTPASEHVTANSQPALMLAQPVATPKSSFDFEDTHSPSPKRMEKAQRRGVPLWALFAVGGGAMAVGMVAVLVLGIMFWPRPKLDPDPVPPPGLEKGELTVEVDDPNLEIAIKLNGNVMEAKTKKRNFTLPLGKGEIQVMDAGGSKLLSRNFEMTRGRTKPMKVKVTAQDLEDARADAWLKLVAAMPADMQVEAVVAKLKERNPGYDGKQTHNVEGGVVTNLDLSGGNLIDISPVRALTGLRSLRCAFTQVSDLSPLKGMSITGVDFGGTKVSDLSPLKDMKLTHVSCAASKVSDLSPLKGMKLTYLQCQNTAVSDLSPLKGMSSLTIVNFGDTKVSDLSPLKDMKLTWLHCQNTAVADLSPLEGMPLQLLWCDFDAKRDAGILRSIKTLQSINLKSAQDFWKEVDAATSADADGFLQLFNGKDLTGWGTPGIIGKDLTGWAPHPYYSVEKGAIIASAAGPTDLQTRRDDYSDFHLRVDARVRNPGGTGAVWLRWPRRIGSSIGYQLIIGPNGVIGLNRQGPSTGGNHRFGNETKQALDEWTTLEVIAEGYRFKVIVNGKTITDVVDEMNVSLRGPIGLQIEKQSVEFRKIEIKELKSSTKPADDAPPAPKMKDDPVADKVLASGLKYVELAVVTGKEARIGDYVTIKSDVPLDGAKFKTTAFTLGSDDIMAGLNEGIYGMKVGGKRRMTIPPSLRVSAKGQKGKIPSNTPLRCEIELMKIGPTEYSRLLAAKDDEFKFQHPMEEGQRYQIDMKSVAFNAYLYLHSPKLQHLADDDDSGGNKNARIVYTAKTTGIHIITAARIGSNFGLYNLIIERK